MDVSGKSELRSWQRYPDGSTNWVFAPSTANAINVTEFAFPVIIAALLIMTTLLLFRRRKPVPHSGII